MKATPSQRLKSLTSKIPNPTSCHLYLGPIARNGYGKLHVHGKSVSVHKLAWIMANGIEPPIKMYGRPAVIEHTCGVKACVNPSHLRLTTQQKNVNHPLTIARKKAAKKRRGPALTDREIKQIHDYLDEGKTGYEISKLTGRSESHISQIRRRRKRDEMTKLLKDVNKRLSRLIGFPPKKPVKPVAPASGGAASAA